MALVLVLALGIRLAEIERTPYTPINDARSYVALGLQVARLGDYGPRDPGAGGSRGPTAYFAPGYPYLLAGIDRLTGELQATGGEVRVARISSAVIGTATVLLIGLLVAELLDPLTGLLAMAIAAVYPVLIELSGVLVVENLLVATELAALLAALRARRASRPLPWVALAGLFVGLTTLVHPDGILIGLPLLVAVSALPRRRLLAPAVLVVVAALTIAPWIVRDAVVLHRFVPVDDEAGITLAGTYNAVSAHANPPYRWLYYRSLSVFRPVARAAHRLTEAALGARLEHRALSYVTHHPLSPLIVAWDNTRRLLELEGARAWQDSAASIGLTAGTARIGVWSFWILALIALAGLATPAVRRIPRWVWSIPVLLWLSIVLVNAETPRFREPLEPYVILPAAAALAALARRLRSGGRTPSLPPERTFTAQSASPG